MSSPSTAPKRDNLFGVCHAIGQAFGFDPLYLRIVFMAAILVNFPVAIVAYLLAALAVLATVGTEKAGRFLGGRVDRTATV